ncbi:hypothetical protein [Actinomadura sp. 7K507]|uniref:hypothetical protein n=1 Tax=Actinomadura sp. 7K507 TaxID=2530365 RepID=UPI0010524B11|nr:hypothetical protein [Actinomadura sp. 7K507]TDC98378.1 hypothetical protein E1285_00130 [Actinomadura sp. 7K507]
MPPSKYFEDEWIQCNLHRAPTAKATDMLSMAWSTPPLTGLTSVSAGLPVGKFRQDLNPYVGRARAPPIHGSRLHLHYRRAHPMLRIGMPATAIGPLQGPSGRVSKYSETLEINDRSTRLQV